MIVTFQQITLFGAGDPKIMAGGISSALITTVLGLVVAIPTTTALRTCLTHKAKTLFLMSAGTGCGRYRRARTSEANQTWKRLKQFAISQKQVGRYSWSSAC